jgi:hypothetical protein
LHSDLSDEDGEPYHTGEQNVKTVNENEIDIKISKETPRHSKPEEIEM